jgi:hypothetical protein
MSDVGVRALGRPRSTKKVRPSLEGMEARLLLYATLGGQWAYGSRITYSFVPDGTNVGGTPSSLFQTMSNDGISQASWQSAFQKAAAVWQAVTNINMVQVPDNGAQLGGPGDQQGDPNFGDIRIAGVPLSSGYLAETFLPPPFNGGSLAGDMLFNTIQPWHINNSYDLETVAIHEFGHALGMDHSAISTADMYAYYNGMKQTLTSDDSSGIQSLYGVNTDVGSNTNFGAATNITSLLNGQGQVALGNLTIAYATDYDYYYVVAPSTGTLTVTMQSTNLSLLSPRVTVFSSAHGTLADANAANSFGATISVQVSVTAGQGYYIRAMAANNGPSGNGAYGLNINFGNSAMPPFSPPNTTVLSQGNQSYGTSGLSSGESRSRHGDIAPVHTVKIHTAHPKKKPASHLSADAPSLVTVGTANSPSALHGFGDYLTIGAITPARGHAVKHTVTPTVNHGKV